VKYREPPDAHPGSSETIMQNQPDALPHYGFRQH
jgi:hypothetical protein